LVVPPPFVVIALNEASAFCNSTDFTRKPSASTVPDWNPSLASLFRSEGDSRGPSTTEEFAEEFFAEGFAAEEFFAEGFAAEEFFAEGFADKDDEGFADEDDDDDGSCALGDVLSMSMVKLLLLALGWNGIAEGSSGYDDEAAASSGDDPNGENGPLASNAFICWGE
jgi:hypothetical protein